MRNYIRENFKTIIAVTVLLVCTVLLIGSSEIIAQVLPKAVDLGYISCEAEKGRIYEYTGKEIEPEFSSFVFRNEKGEIISVKKGDFEVLSYENNVEIGYANAEVALEGYRGSILFEGAFEIVLGQVKGLQMTDATKTNVDLAWDKVPGADGYVVHRSSDNGNTYHEVQNIQDGKVTTYQDLDIALNTTYLYQVSAYMNKDTETVRGAASDSVRYTTPLDIPVMTGVTSIDYQTLKVEWNLVDGAVGYQIYRSTEEAGEYQCIGEVTDKTVNSYTDGTCTLGKTYFYYIRTCQQIEEEMIYGEPSGIISGSTALNQVSLSGSTNGEKTTAALKWKAVAGATGYEIYRSVNSSNEFKLVKKIENANTLSWSESGLTATSEYYYRVRAYAVLEGTNYTGSYSGTYAKPVKINYNYSSAELGSFSAVLDYVGYPYVYGGKSPSGWDCSGFTSWVMENLYGVSIAKGTAGQAAGGTAVSLYDRSSWKAGDILCYKSGGRVSHVAIYLGDGKMIHALSEKYDTFVQDVDTYERWDSNTLSSVRRYLQ
ncbi:MAG: C40 family peptidase [Tyzzerella sp.]|nr:C40 family peptidase [Tyzzerella sp.]